MTLIWCPKCSTCKKMKQWLEDNKVSYKTKEIMSETPIAQELETWHQS